MEILKAQKSHRGRIVKRVKTEPRNQNIFMSGEVIDLTWTVWMIWSKYVHLKHDIIFTDALVLYARIRSLNKTYSWDL